MFCNHCGAEIEDSSLYCNKCGTRFEYVDNKIVGQPLGKKKMSGWMKTFIIIPAVFFGLLLIGAFSYSGFEETEFDTIEESSQQNLSILPPESTIMHITIHPLPRGVNSVYANAVREANSEWEQYENILFRETSSSLDADLVIGWVKEFGGEHLGYALGESYIEVGIGDSFCLGKWQSYTYQTVKHIAMHEIGHVLGYDHSNNPNDVMYHTLFTKYEIDVDETEFLPDGASRFYPVCTKNSVAEYVFEVTSDTPLDIWIVSSRNDFDLLTDEKTFTHYPSCQTEEKTFYKKTCAIGQGAGIVLWNPTTFGLGKDAQFHVKIKEL